MVRARRPTPTLVAAAIDDVTATRSITSDGPMAIGEFNGDATFSFDARTARAAGESIDASDGPRAWPDAPADIGIVDAASGAAWAGCSELPLPFP